MEAKLFSDIPFLEFNERIKDYDNGGEEEKPFKSTLFKPHERPWSLEQYPLSLVENQERVAERVK